MWMKWLILAGLFFVGEIVTTGFILFWFGIAAIVGAVLAFSGLNFFVQVGVFILTASILIIFTKPLTKGLNKPKDIPSNVFALIGKTGTVINDINNLEGAGQVKIGGEVWKAESEDGSKIPAESIVEILKIEGVKVIVKLKNKGGNE